MEYSKDQLIDTINKLSAELEKEKKVASQLHSAASAGSNISFQAQNLIEWQLDLSKELELISHQLRGHVIERDEDGNEYWAEPTVIINGKKVTDEERKLLNEKGAQEVEKIIRNYLNRNTLLSNYDETTIKQRMYQFAERLRRFIFLNYEEFGLTTDYKMKHFEMIVMNICDMVESAYYRALGGGERESLRTARQVTQSEGMNNMPVYPGISGGKEKKSRWNPFSWGN